MHVESVAGRGGKKPAQIAGRKLTVGRPPFVYGFWIALVAALYPLCKWFAGVKQRPTDQRNTTLPPPMGVSTDRDSLTNVGEPHRLAVCQRSVSVRGSSA